MLSISSVRTETTMSVSMNIFFHFGAVFVDMEKSFYKIGPRTAAVLCFHVYK